MGRATLGETAPGVSDRLGTATEHLSVGHSRAVHASHALKAADDGARVPLGAPDAWIAAGLLLVGVAAPALLATWTHSIGIPRNDDWAYRRVLVEFTQTSRLSLVGWGSMTLVGQILWAAPFVLLLGGGHWVPSLSVAVVASAGLACAYVLARGQLARRFAAASVLLVVAVPGFALSTSDFMTDVPAFSAEMVCLLLGALALRSTGGAQVAWLASSMAAGLFGFSIREFDLAAPLAVLLVLAATGRLKVQDCALSAGGLLAACGAVYWWTSSLPGSQPKAFGLPTAASWDVLGGVYFTLSFMVSPVLPWALVRWRAWRPWPSAVPAALVLMAGGLLVARHHPLFIGNYLDEQGAGGGRVLAGARPELFPAPAWEAFRVIALAAGAILAAALAGAGWDRLHASRTSQAKRQHAQVLGPLGPVWAERQLLLAFTWVSVIILIGYGLLFRAAFWDRYLWPALFGVAVLVLGRRRASGPGHVALSLVVPVAAAGALATLIAVAGAAVTLNADAYDGARWSAGEDLVKAGYPSGAVDAGFDWVGEHARVVARPGRAIAGAPRYEMWYDEMFAGFHDCAVVSASPLLGASLQLIRTVSYDELVFAVPHHLYIYVVENVRCQALRR